jgi:hypothetical protein
MATRTGLANFKTVKDAVKYYKEYGCNRADVLAKIENKQIGIGEPEIPYHISSRPGFQLRTDFEGRYYYMHD